MASTVSFFLFYMTAVNTDEVKAQFFFLQFFSWKVKINHRIPIFASLYHLFCGFKNAQNQPCIFKIYLCLKNFYIQTDFFSYKKYFYSIEKKNVFNEIFLFIDFRQSNLIFHLLRFVYCLRGAKYTFTSIGFVLDLIVPLH